MMTRSGGDNSLRSLCVGALSAASIGLFGLALTQQSPTKLVTADSPLSSSARTALGMRKSAEAPKPGSSDQGIMELASFSSDFFETLENEASEEAIRQIKLISARHLVQKLGLGEVSRGEPPVEIGDEEKRMLIKKFSHIILTPVEHNIVFSPKKLDIKSSFDYFNPDSKPKSETEVVKALVEDPSRCFEILTTLFIDVACITQRHIDKVAESGPFMVERPLTMLALFRSHPMARLIFLTLPYRIDKIAALFVFCNKAYGFDTVTALPQLQEENPTPMPLTYVNAFDRNFACAEVKDDGKTVTTEDYLLKTELPQVSSAKELSQLIETLKQEAKIPAAHELVVACVKLSDPKTGAETSFLCSDVGLVASLQKHVESLNSADDFVWSARKPCVDAIFVDRRYSHLMKNHIVEAFKMLEDYQIGDGKLEARSAHLLDKMKEGFQAITDKE